MRPRKAGILLMAWILFLWVGAGACGSYPGYWEKEIDTTVSRINAAQKDGDFSFGFLTDFHNMTNAGHSPALLQDVMERCGIKNYINGGDIATDGGLSTEQMVIEDLQDAECKFNEIADKCLKVEGNHDSAYSTLGDGQYYLQNLTPDRIRDIYFKAQTQNSNLFFAATGNYYYCDDEENQIRYIILNSQDKGYGESWDGRAADNKMWEFAFRQEQISWLAYWALVVPSDDWAVVVSSHVAPGENEQTGSDYPVTNYEIVIGLLEAFNNRTSYMNVSMSLEYPAAVYADYTDKGGDIICWVAGHSHADKLFKLDGINVVVCLDDSPLHEPGTPEKIKGTATEQAFDIFTVNKNTKTVIITRVGAGSDRQFSY